MRVLRPEDYANLHIYRALKISKIDEESIHDLRVSIRKYYDVLSSLYPAYEDSECLYLAKELLSSLGKIRDSDICSIEMKNRGEIAFKIIRKKDILSKCMIKKVYGSRLLIYNRILKIYESIPQTSEFHELRKNVRKARNLVESLGYDSQELKTLAKTMGDLRDEMLKMMCRGVPPPTVEISSYKEEARKALLKILVSQNEFRHYKVS